MSISVTIEIFWFPELPDIKSFSSHLWRSILMLAIGASSASSGKDINMSSAVCHRV